MTTLNSQETEGFVEASRGWTIRAHTHDSEVAHRVSKDRIGQDQTNVPSSRIRSHIEVAKPADAGLAQKWVPVEAADPGNTSLGEGHKKQLPALSESILS